MDRAASPFLQRKKDGKLVNEEGTRADGPEAKRGSVWEMIDGSDTARRQRKNTGGNRGEERSRLRDVSWGRNNRMGLWRFEVLVPQPLKGSGKAQFYLCGHLCKEIKSLVLNNFRRSCRRPDSTHLPVTCEKEESHLNFLSLCFPQKNTLPL